jgi:Fic family protein
MFERKLAFDFKSTQEVIRKISRIDGFKGTWAVLETRENRYLKELRRIATIQSIGSSTRIEGVTMTDAEIEQLLSNLRISKLNTRDEQEVIGYFNVLDLILENATDIDLTESSIRQLHGLLLKHSQKDSNHRGNYKNLPNKVVASYPDGKQKVIFNTTAPHLVEKEMSELVAWTTAQLRTGEIHSLMTIGLFIYEFLSIHPFQDGNGRLSRLLTTLLLVRQGYDFVQYVSLENIIEQRKKDYYRVLMNAQQHRYTEKEVIRDWLLFFLDCLETLIAKLEAKYKAYEAKGTYLNERQKQVRDWITKRQPVKIADIAAELSAYSMNTLKKDVQQLVKQGVLQKIGSGKATFYVTPPHQGDKTL